MSIDYKKGDIQVTRCQTILLPISCDGEVEKNHLPILRRYPMMQERMKKYLKDGSLVIGKLWLYRHRAERFVLVCPLTERASDAPSPEFVSFILKKLRDCYEKKGITSIALPLISKDLKELQVGILSEFAIHVEFYEEEIPLSQTLPPLVEKLVGSLEADDIARIKQVLCFDE